VSTSSNGAAAAVAACPVVRQIVALAIKGFLSTWRKLFGSGWRAENVNGSSSSEKLLLSLRCHRIAMVQPAKSRKGLNLAFSR
jgi:hypothetical protein